MCKCTPNVRTPFCGKLGCEWPNSKPEGARYAAADEAIERALWARTCPAYDFDNPAHDYADILHEAIRMAREKAVDFLTGMRRDGALETANAYLASRPFYRCEAYS